MVRFLILLALTCFISACSYTSIGQPTISTQLQSQPETIVVGYVRNAKQPFYEGVASGLEGLAGVHVAIKPGVIENPTHLILVLTGELDVKARDSFGEKVGRNLVGFGVLRSEVSGMFELKAFGKDPLLTFDASEFYNGGTGLGGLLDIPGLFLCPLKDGIPFFCQTDLIDTDTMQKRLGKEVGNNIRKWVAAGGGKNTEF